MSCALPFLGQLSVRGVRAATFALCASALLAQPAAACSKSRFPEAIWPTAAFFLGRAGSDTVSTGAGSVEYVVSAGHFGRARDRSIYGLMVDVERIGGPAKASMPRGTRRVIIVPWDYDASCQAVPYTRSVRWVAAGTRGLYSAELRPKAQWIDGVPTLDAHNPSAEPYTGIATGGRIAAYIGTPDSALTPDQLFEVVERIPTSEAMQHDADAAILPLATWMQRHPALARAYPLREIASNVGFRRYAAALRRVRHPVGGTWELTFASDGQPARIVYIRTSASPSTSEPDASAPRSTDPFAVRPSAVYNFLTVSAASEAQLPASCRDSRYDSDRQSYLNVLATPDGSDASTIRYTGNVEATTFPRAFPGDTTIRRFADESEQTFSRLYSRKAPPRERYAGSVTLRRDGTGDMLREDTLADGRRIRVTGRRVSTQTIACED